MMVETEVERRSCEVVEDELVDDDATLKLTLVRGRLTSVLNES